MARNNTPKVYKRVSGYDGYIRNVAYDLLKDTGYCFDGWDVCVVDQKRGRCKYSSKTITIPLWTFDKEDGYVEYYVAHELAHVFDKSSGSHGYEFMRVFKEICPEEFQYHEYGYKPRNAKAAGVSQMGRKQ